MRILVTAVGTSTSVGIIKNIRKYRPQWTIIGTDTNAYAYTAGSQLVDLFYRIPKATTSCYIECLKNIIEKECIDYIWPVNDAEIRAVSGDQEIRNKTIIADKSIIDIVFDKLCATSKMAEIGIRSPRILKERTEKRCIIRDRIGVGSTGISIYERFSMDRLTEGRFAQEYIDGTEYTVDVLSDIEGKPIYIIPRIRYEVKAGVSTKAIIAKDDGLIGITESILGSMPIPGFSNIQFIIDEEGKAFFIEVNPRIGGGTSASLLAVPQMFPAFIDMIEGKKQASAPLNVGVKWGAVITRYYEEIIYYREGIK